MNRLNFFLGSFFAFIIGVSFAQDPITVNGIAINTPAGGGSPNSCSGGYKVRNNGVPAPAFNTPAGCVTLTDGTAANGEGNIWLCDPLDLTNDFNLTFTANFGTNPNSGDGIAFVLNGNNDAPLGGVGGNIGYATASNNVAVEFDTWPDADIACHHAEINQNGFSTNLSAPIPLKSCCGSVVDGSDYSICITWEVSSGTTGTLTATFDGNVVGTYTGDLAALLGGNSAPNWGFTSGCGAAGGQIQTVCGVNMDNQGSTVSSCTTCTPPTVTATPTSETICSGETTNLSISGSAGTDYCWQAIDNLNVNGETSTLTTETSANFTIGETLTNGVPGTQTVTYTVYPESSSGCFGTPLTLTVTVLDSGDPLCNCATPTLVITDPATACFPNTVDLTHPDVTAGSDPGTLSYWEDAAATIALASPGTVNTTGTYYIMLDIGGGCFTIEPVNAVVDNPPTASNPGPLSFECVADVPAPDVTVVTDENDDITIPPTVTWLSDVSDNASCPETITRTYRVQDACANFVDVTQTITIIPVTNPTEIGGPVATASTVNCLANASAPALPVVQDVCGNVLTPAALVVTDSPDPITCEGTRTYEYTYTDCAGNPFVWTYTYTIDLTTAPAESGGPVSTSGGTVECVADATAPTTLPTIQDACGNTLSPSGPTVGGTYVDCEGTYTYTYDYVDCAGNTFQWVYTYTIDITTAPAEVGGPVATASTVECIADAVSPILPNIEDVCGNTLTPIGVTNGGTYVDCEGTYTYVYDYVDCAGNPFQWTYTYTIDITTAPAEVGGPVATASTVECFADAVVPTLPNIEDACGNTLTPTGVTNGGTYVDCEGTYTYVYDYVDCAGNPFQWTYTYTIDLTTAPTEVGGPVATASTVECIADAVAPTLPNIEDACGNTLTPTGVTNGGTYVDCEGTYTYVYDYEDCAGNPFQWTYTYTIDLTTAPTEIGGPVSTNGGTVECLADATAPTTLPVIEDACGNVLTPSAPTNGGTYVDCEGTYTYVYDYIDCAGNPFQWTYTYTIDVTTPPAEVGGPLSTSGGSVNCPADATAPATLPVVQDVCGNVLTPVETAPNLSGCSGLGIDWIYTYTDCAGNDFVWTYTYTVNLATGPAEVGGPVSTSGGTVECLADATAPTTLPVIEDACGNVLTPSAPTNGGTYVDCEGTYTYVYDYVDCAGNPFQWTYTYTIDVTTAPAEVGGPVATASTVECIADAVAPTLPVIEDACGNVLTPSAPTNGGTYVDCEGTYTYVYDYVDCAGNPFQWTYTYTIDLTTAPTEVGGPATTASTVECISDAVAPTLPNIEDACGNTLTPTGVTNGGTYVDCEGTYTYVYDYEDCAGNPFQWTYTYTIDLTTAPTEIGGPVSTNGGTVECLADATAPTTLPVIEDACGNVFTPSAPTNGGTYVDCEGTYTYVYDYVDCAGTPFQWTYTYTIDVTTPPAEVGGPVSTSGGSVNCPADAVAPATLPVVEDVCGNVLTPVETAPNPGGCTGLGIDWIYTYTDCAGNDFVWTYTYTVNLATGPAEVGGPVSTNGGTVECLSDATAPTTLPVIEDACGNVLIPSAGSPTIGGTYVGCEGTYTYTYDYQDCAGNPFQWTYTYTIDVTTAPAEVGGPVATASTVECIADAVAPTLPVIEDVCGNVLTPSAPTNGGTYVDCEGTYTYVYDYVDCAGNPFQWTYTYTIDLTTAPTEVGGPVATASTVECIADAVAPTLPVIEDACGNVLTPSAPTNGGTYVDCEGTYTYVYDYIDCAGNPFQWIYTYTIDLTTVPTEIGGPVSTNGGTVECLADATAPTILPVIEDVCGNVLTPSAPTNGGTYVDCEGTYTYVYDYVDCAGNPFQWTYTYTIDITTAPAEVGGPVATASTVECIADAVPPTLPVIEDVCGNVLTPSAPTSGGTYVDCEGTYTYVYDYVDCAGNPFQWTYTYTIDVTTGPVEVGGPASTNGGTVECLADATAPTTLPVIEDACGNVLTPSAPTNGGTYVDCEGTYTYVYDYVDCAGNPFQWTYTYTIDVTTGPAEVGGPVATATTVQCEADAIAPSTLPIIEDVCGNILSPTGPVVIETPNPLTCIGTREFEYTYTDCAGNPFVWTYTVTVDDNIAPTASNPTTLNIPVGPAPAPDPTVVTDEADNCTVNPTVTWVSDVSDNNVCPETVTRTYSVADDCGNEIFVTQTIIIGDNNPVAIASNNGPVCNGDPIDLSETAGDAASWSWTSSGAGVITLDTDQNPVVTGAVDGEVFTVTITDPAGCTATAQTTVSIVASPVLDQPNDTTVCDLFTLGVIQGTTLTGNEAYYNNWPSAGGAVITGDLTSSQTVYVYDFAGSCADSVSFSLTVNTTPTITAMDPAAVCEPGLVDISGSASTDLGALTWYTDQVLTNPVVDQTQVNAGTYYAEASNLGCISIDSVVAVVNPLPPAPIAGTDSTYCDSWVIENMTATGTGGTLNWYLDTLSGSIGTGDAYAPDMNIGTTVYYVTETLLGCEGPSSAVTITIEICDITIPTAFTPNGDMNNDNWEILNLDNVYPNNTVRVYNRWGSILFEHISNDGANLYDQNRWDGTYEGEQLPVGSYYYVIELNDAEGNVQTGAISIILD